MFLVLFLRLLLPLPSSSFRRQLTPHSPFRLPFGAVGVFPTPPGILLPNPPCSVSGMTILTLPSPPAISNLVSFRRSTEKFPLKKFRTCREPCSLLALESYFRNSAIVRFPRRPLWLVLLFSMLFSIPFFVARHIHYTSPTLSRGLLASIIVVSCSVLEYSLASS